MMTMSAPRVLAATFALAVLHTSGASAQQFVIFDETWVHSADIPDSHYRVDASPETPADLTSPIDYASGTVHLHMDVLTKPTDEPTRMQVCFEAQPTYGCTSQSPDYSATGLVEWSTPVSSFWSPGTPDWSMGSGRVAAILKDTENGKPSADNVGAERAARFMPTEIHLVLTWVAPGATYVPPTEMPDAGPPIMDAGASDAASADAGMEPDAALVDAGARDAGRDEVFDAAGADGAAPDVGGPAGDGGGCAVSRGETRANFAVLLLVAGVVLSRRRRKR